MRSSYNTVVYSCANVSFVTIMSVNVAVLDSHNVPYRNASITCTRASKVIHIFRLQKPFSTFCPLHRHNSFAFTEQNAGHFQLNIIICKTNIRFLLPRTVEKGLCQWFAGYILFFLFK